MRRWVGLVACAAGLWGCTSILGDFNVGDASTTDATSDVTPEASTDTGGPEVTADVVTKDSPAEAETGPSCGGINEACCANNVCNSGSCCGGVCADLASDAKNCGACGHDCLGGTCATNQCQPQQLAKVSDTRPGRVRLDATNAYFITVNGSHSGSLYSCSQQGCTAPTQLFGNLNYGYDLALDDNATTAYVSDFNNAKLWSCALSGCGQLPSAVQVPVSGNVAGIAFRSEIFAVVGAQPHEFKITGQNDVSLGNNNEGANWITAPPSSAYAYWQNSGSHSVRVGKDGVAQSGADFWGSTTDLVFQVEANSAYVAWVGSASSTTIYSCAIGTSCAANNVLGTPENVGGESGALTVDPATSMVYWVGIDGTASHVLVRACAASGCNKPTTVASVATAQGGAVAGGVTSNTSFVFFTMEDKGSVYLYRVAK